MRQQYVKTPSLLEELYITYLTDKIEAMGNAYKRTQAKFLAEEDMATRIAINSAMAALVDRMADITDVLEKYRELNQLT